MPERLHDIEKTRSPRALDYAMALCAVTIWGGSFAATKYALVQAEPSLILCLRLAMTLPVLAAGCALGGELRLPNRREALVLAVLGFQGIFFSHRRASRSSSPQARSRRPRRAPPSARGVTS